jgi:hypothetical protein
MANIIGMTVGHKRRGNKNGSNPMPTKMPIATFIIVWFVVVLNAA